MAPTTRERMLLSTALLVRERGARATSIDDVITHAQAPRGSVYHHFPGGREQLLREATDLAADWVTRRLERIEDPVEALDMFVDQLAAGCPIVAVAVEEGTDAQAAAGGAFRRWQTALSDALERAGARSPESLAALVIAAIEGAVVMSRAQGDPAPLDLVRDQLHDLLRSALR